jgi:hypothetical protein
MEDRVRCFRGFVVALILTTMLGVSANAQSPPNAGVQSSGPEDAQLLINIDKSRQRMTVFLEGTQKYDWPVSTGRAGYSTPTGTYIATSMNEIWYSKEWDNSPMPHSIFFIKDGHAIHGSYEVKSLGKAVSHGCVRISPANATTLYGLVKKNGLKNTKVVLTGVTPGGEYKLTKSARPPGGHAGSDRYTSQNNHTRAPQWSDEFFGHSFSSTNYSDEYRRW